MSSAPTSGWGLLDGLKVVEFAQVVAGPLAGGLLADHGATVIHVEAPGDGDVARRMGPDKDGVHLWWKVSGRNKRSVSIDLRQQQGQELAHRLVAWADVVVTGLRASTLERWRIDWQTLHELNPQLVMLQISGYGANSTLADAPGLGKVGEARSGVVHLTGDADGRPLHTGFSHGDAVSGLMGSFAIMTALYRKAHDPDFRGEWIDLALFEPLYRLIEWQVIVHDQLGWVPTRAGNQLAVAPAAVVNSYLSADADWITVTTATPRSVANVRKLLGIADDPMSDPAEESARLDAALQTWVSERATDVCLAEMAGVEVIASRVFDMADIMADATYQERQDVISVSDGDLGDVRMQAALPHVTNYPGRVWRTGPGLGEDNRLVLTDWIGVTDQEFEDLERDGVI